MSTFNIRKVLKQSLTKPSERFGPTILEVNHVFIGQKMKDYRMFYSVQAVDVADYMSLSKTTISFLEAGQRLWSKELMHEYLEAVEHYANLPTRQKEPLASAT